MGMKVFISSLINVIILGGCLSFTNSTEERHAYTQEDLVSDEVVSELSEDPYKTWFQRTDLKGQDAIEIGDLILDNHIYSFDIWEPYKYEELDWHMEPF